MAISAIFLGNLALAVFQSTDHSADVLAAVAERATELDPRQIERVSNAPELGAGHGGIRNFRCWAASDESDSGSPKGYLDQNSAGEPREASARDAGPICEVGEQRAGAGVGSQEQNQ